MRTNPFYDAWLFLIGDTGDHQRSGVPHLLVVIFLAALLASVLIAWRNWQRDPTQRTIGHLATWFMRVMIGCMWPRLIVETSAADFWGVPILARAGDPERGLRLAQLDHSARAGPQYYIGKSAGIPYRVRHGAI